MSSLNSLKVAWCPAQDGWVIPNPSGEKTHFEKGKKVLLGILVARDCTGLHEGASSCTGLHVSARRCTNSPFKYSPLNI
jgi:hypothetical protein